MADLVDTFTFFSQLTKKTVGTNTVTQKIEPKNLEEIKKAHTFPNSRTEEKR